MSQHLTEINAQKSTIQFDGFKLDETLAPVLFEKEIKKFLLIIIWIIQIEMKMQ